MYPVHAKTEEQQGQRHRQPLQRLDLMHGTPEPGDGEYPEQQHKGAMQPRIIERMDPGAISAAECCGGLPHCDYL
ncbi:hypothetical protein [Pseudomonas sp. VI4.1]|uniref:hypothetical protein n=1 Tax=Pseudomonas sp. VI4.1 TaxID=1941346 RepID=UPI00211398A1|nr:hypothetical protein [Pseudomonas sp. VI4.1]